MVARCVSEGLESILEKRFDVLDHGFVRVVDYMGNDNAIVQAARVSYGKGTKQVNQDRGLIRYLMRHKHTTPFEMCEIKFHVKLPIFVGRQWIRHRTASVNEYSARYSILDGEFYAPKLEHVAKQSVNNKQGRGDALSEERAASVLEVLKSDATMCYGHYLDMLGLSDKDAQDESLGEGAVARELARINLPVSFYTQWYWKVNLHNLMHFLKLRADPHAQYEIRAYADVMLDIMKSWVPYAYEAFESYVLGSKTFSKEAMAALRQILMHKQCNPDSLQHDPELMSKREWDEFVAALFGE